MSWSSLLWPGRCALLGGLVLALLLRPAAAWADAAAVEELTLTDPEGDDHGPGSYRYPIDERVRPGSFDLVEIGLGVQDDDLAVRACFRVRPKRLEGVWLSRHERVDVLPMVVDVYLDTRSVGQEGLSRALPGRAVDFGPPFAWERVLVMQPRARVFLSWLAVVDEELEGRTSATDAVRIRGRCLHARFPTGKLGPPRPDWSVAVLVTGARYHANFRLADRLLGSYSKGEFTREVLPIPGSCVADDEDQTDCAFGGCEPCGYHPRVIDALLSGRQEEVLSGYSAVERRFARILGVRLGGPGTPALPAAQTGAVASAPAVAPASYRVADTRGALLSLVGGPPRTVGELGALSDADGAPAGTVVVTSVAGPVTVVQRVSGDGEVAAGWWVRFDAAKPASSAGAH